MKDITPKENIEENMTPLEEEVVTTPQVEESTLLEWQADEFRTYTRNTLWYIAVIIFSLGVIGYSVYKRDWFIIVIVFIVDAFLFWYSKKKPETVNHRITQLGIYAGTHFHPYSEIHSYWISYTKIGRFLNVVFNKTYLPLLTIELKELDPLHIKSILSKYIPEQENRNETFVDRISRLLKL